MESVLRKANPSTATALSRRCRFGLVALLTVLTGACDATTPATGTTTGTASSSAVAPPACPATDIAGFVAAFAESPTLQKAFTAPVVDTAFIDWSAQPEPAESVEPMSRDALRFPVMPDRARQQAEGLRYRELGNEGGRATIALEVPDTGTRLLYTFKRDACWALVKIVDPAFGKAFPGGPAAGDARHAATPAAVDAGDAASGGPGATFAACMARAGSRDIDRAGCLTAERDRQDARLNRLYRELLGHLQGDRRERMVEAQRLWVQLRQKDGAFEASVLDELGPMGNLQSVENDARAIGQRADQLEKYLALSKL